MQMAGKAILMIEPDEMIRMSHRDIVALEGYIDYGTADYTSGLEFVRTHGIDLVVMPYYINRQSGEAFVTALREDPATAAVQILVYGFAKFLREGSWQPDPYLAAYYTPAQFLEAVKKALKASLK